MIRATRRLLQAVPTTAHPANSPSSLRTKISTGIAGYPVHPEPLRALSQTYQGTLTLLQQIPASAVYRQSTESITKERLEAIKSIGGQGTEQEIEAVEARIGAGVIEEVLEQAQGELQLAGKMIEWKAWEDLETPAVPGQWDQFKQTPSTTTPDDLPQN
ncbi:complex I NDUFA5 subunit family protein [Sporobolomyces salmoneus]|uniref:complex I NDUFA5 subunit family protein n=1 Tax=Sporobolomyces salmoneus TaxID=183962 RepID=UPI0031795AB6